MNDLLGLLTWPSKVGPTGGHLHHPTSGPPNK